MQSTQYKALESLKRSHTNLHQSIERMQNGESTVVGKANIAKIICELSHALARL